MKTVTVSASRRYDILIERGLLRRAGELVRGVTNAGTVMLVSDDSVWPLYGEAVQKSLVDAGFSVCRFVFPHGESSKCAKTYLALLDALCENRLTRADAALALGGGVVGDLTGFAASTYLRGIGFIQIPTTLLAMVDSSVGGKTAIDLPAGKNLAGTFYQPCLVLCDPDCLDSLPDEIFRDGCAEVIKYAVLGNAPFFEELNRTPPRTHLEHIIETCVRMKRDIVAQDEFDRGQRQLLNLGHTFGHALEKFYHFEKLSHGFAVGIGMVLMARLGEAAGLTQAGTAKQIEGLLQKYGLPVRDPAPLEALLKATALDKKSTSSTIRIVLLEKIGVSFVKELSHDEFYRLAGKALA